MEFGWAMGRDRLTNVFREFSPILLCPHPIAIHDLLP